MAAREPTFQQGAHLALANTQLRRNLGKATSTIRAKRANVVGEVPDWEALREAGRTIKAHTLQHLDEYLRQLEASGTRAGGQVPWARNAAEANRIIVELVPATGARYERAQRLGRWGQAPLVQEGVITWLPGMLAGWTATRDLRALPKQTFREWWQQQEGQHA